MPSPESSAESEVYSERKGMKVASIVVALTLILQIIPTSRSSGFALAMDASPSRESDLPITQSADHPTPLAQDECNRWFYSARENVSGVIVLTHGQNMSPYAFDEMAQAFAERGFDVYRGLAELKINGNYHTLKEPSLKISTA